MIGPNPAPSAVAIKIDVDWNQADIQHHWELFLVDEDGQAVLVDTPDGEKPIEVRGDFMVGKPPNIPEGSPIDVALAINMMPMPLKHSSRFIWHFVIDGEMQEDWTLSFTTRPAENDL